MLLLLLLLVLLVVVAFLGVGAGPGMLVPVILMVSMVTKERFMKKREKLQEKQGETKQEKAFTRRTMNSKEVLCDGKKKSTLCTSEGEQGKSGLDFGDAWLGWRVVVISTSSELKDCFQLWWQPGGRLGKGQRKTINELTRNLTEKEGRSGVVSVWYWIECQSDAKHRCQSSRPSTHRRLSRLLRTNFFPLFVLVVRGPSF